MRIAITGTPGTGKTTVSKILSERLGLPLYNLSELIKERGLYTEYDSDRDSYVVDTEKLREFFSDRDSFIAEGLVSHYLPAEFVVVLRTNPSVLRERLKGRNYREEKVEENVEAERIGFIATEVFENPMGRKVIQIDTTNRSPEEVADLIERALRGEEIFDEIDWLEDEAGGNQGPLLL